MKDEGLHSLGIHQNTKDKNQSTKIEINNNGNGNIIITKSTKTPVDGLNIIKIISSFLNNIKLLK